MHSLYPIDRANKENHAQMLIWTILGVVYLKLMCILYDITTKIIVLVSV